MEKRQKKIKKIAFLGLLTAVAMLLSYVEALLPSPVAAVPGIKMGLPNVAIIFVLYRFGSKEAALVSAVRVIMVSLLFGNPMTFIYSIAGAMLSIVVMIVLKKLNFLSTVGVSVAGGVFHNAGQILVAMFLLGTAELAHYMIVLALSGTLSGVFVGICGALMIKKLPMYKI
ncbi:MAG: Gx transporter family protein [Clostridia bacterium]|nr:Gx transporter family protein [Clostridia bacterium]